jgi:outer membrane protein assembly factor BamB
MRYLCLLLGFTLIAGCGKETATSPSKPQYAEASSELIAKPSEKKEEGPDAESETIPVAAVKEPHPDDGNLPSNLWTRKTGDDWPTFLGPTGDSKSTEVGILKEWPEAGPRVVWQRRLGEGYGIGSIARGRIYQADRMRNTARLVCLNAETGEELWKHEYETDYVDTYGYDGGPRCSPVIDGDRVYMYGVEGMLYCLKAATGDEIWKVDTVKDFHVIQNFFGVGSTPVIEGGNLIVMVGGSPDDEISVEGASGNGTGIVAFNKHTGKVVYKLSDELASYASLKLATIGSRRWCFAFCRGGLLGFDPNTGKQDFHYPWRAKILESVNASMPVVSGKEVFISETYGPGSSLLQVIPGDARVVWADDARKRDKAMQTHWNTPVLVDGYLYGSSGRHTENAELRCIEWKTGKVMWSQPGLTRCSLLHVDGHFVCLGEYGQLQLLKVNPEKYDVVAEVLLREEAGPLLPEPPPPLLKYPAWAAPILSHGLLYVRGAGKLVCLELIPEKK